MMVEARALRGAIPESFETATLDWDDKVTLALRALYRGCGYQRYRMSAFEPYDIYLANKGFLKDDAVVTFTDPQGRLMALKPDVTMSIVKNTAPETVYEKLYYIENVFRIQAGSGEFGEIAQVGLEYIGCEQGLPETAVEAEVIGLAMESLALISDSHLLTLSHMGLLAAAIAACGLGEVEATRVRAALSSKNVATLDTLLAGYDVAPEARASLNALARCADPLPRALETLATLPLDGDARNAFDDLCDLTALLQDEGHADRIFLDLSLVGEADYYNGVTFQGYIEGLPRAVLSGGRYDKLMARFGKTQCAIGFAVYLGEIARALIER